MTDQGLQRISGLGTFDMTNILSQAALLLNRTYQLLSTESLLRIHKLSGFDITVPYWFRVYRHSFVPNAELLQNIRSNLPTLRSLRVHVCHEAIDHQQLYNTEISRPGLYRGDAQLTILKHEIPMQLERKGRKAIVNRLTEENRSSTTTHRILALISYV
jgi:hypothetical protein